MRVQGKRKINILINETCLKSKKITLESYCNWRKKISWFICLLKLKIKKIPTTMRQSQKHIFNKSLGNFFPKYIYNAVYLFVPLMINKNAIFPHYFLFSVNQSYHLSSNAMFHYLVIFFHFFNFEIIFCKSYKNNS